MNKKQLEEFEFDIVSIDEAFFNSNTERMASFGVTKQDLIDENRKCYTESLDEEIKRLNNKGEMKFSYPVGIYVLTFIYDPTEDYLNKLVGFLESLTKEENNAYLEKAFIYDCSDYCGGGVHTKTQCMFAIDLKYLEEYFFNELDTKKIINTANRFTGLVPYLFDNGYEELYKRTINICKYLINRFGIQVGQMTFSLLNFLKQKDKDNYQIIYNEFLKVKAQNEEPWTISKDYNYHGRFGWGLYVRDAYWRKNISFMDFLD